MAPPRARAAPDDSETSSTKEKERQANGAVIAAPSSKGRRNTSSIMPPGSSVKDVVAPASGGVDTNGGQVQEGISGISWPSIPTSILHAYRHAYRLSTPSAFKSSLNQTVLSNPGIGRHSPTMAVKKDRRRVGKEQLAMAVRKNFNGLAIHEGEVVVDFLYKKPFRALSKMSLANTGRAIPIRLLNAPKACQRGHSAISSRIQARDFSVCFGGATKGIVRPRVEFRRRPPVNRRAFNSSPALFATKNPYTILGVDKSATSSDIKKAYYSLAKKYHPDTNKEPDAKDRFAELQSAYELLSDPKKKEAWDHHGAAAFDQSGGFDPSAGAGGPFGGAAGAGGFSGFGGGFGADFSFEDLFSAFGGGGGRGRRSRGGPFAEEVLVGENIEVQASISFMDAAKGTSQDIHITPLVKCRICAGSGLKKGTKRTECKRCGGTGTRVHFMQGGFQMASTCDACGGQGITIPRGGECSTCSGNGVVRGKKAVTVEIPGGVEDGMRLRVSGEGDAPPTGMAANPSVRSTNGDLYVFIRVAPDSKFSRQGSDVLYTATIPFTTAVLGGEVKIPTLDGDVKVKIATGTGTGDKITLGGMGMRKLGGRRGAQGDLQVEFKVMMPKYLSANERTLLELLADEVGDKTAKRVMNLGQNPLQLFITVPSAISAAA
ncbi:hypothetical protein FGG08_006962 [Glutinoglossum americanum]|uniref:DnaJ homolog 1, mitochondrial n=1 Tax=Glutinoglossum americanum TaxID=1670608 RepID=A0A9P8HUY4_9PEZI|nr:hypothetical protein FGG08_006962 [Glutinoglossum americanum]